MHTDPSTSGRKYRKPVNNAVFIPNESLFAVSAGGYECIPIKAHAAVATQHMPCRLSCCSVGNTIGAYTRYIIIYLLTPIVVCTMKFSN